MQKFLKFFAFFHHVCLFKPRERPFWLFIFVIRFQFSSCFLVRNLSFQTYVTIKCQIQFMNEGNHIIAMVKIKFLRQFSSVIVKMNKSSIVFRSTRELSCTLRLVACGFEVSYCPTDNQPLGATIDTRQCQSLDLDGKQSQVQVPPTTAGQKVPMVIDLHGKNS